MSRLRKGASRDRRTSLPVALRKELVVNDSQDSGTGQNSDLISKLGETRGREKVACRRELRKAKRIMKKRDRETARAAWSQRRQSSHTLVSGERSDCMSYDTVATPKVMLQKPSSSVPSGTETEPKVVGENDRTETEHVVPTGQCHNVDFRDPDELECKRLETLLGLRKKRRRLQSVGKVLQSSDIFGDDPELTNLVDFCDSAKRRRGDSERRAGWSDSPPSDDALSQYGSMPCEDNRLDLWQSGNKNIATEQVRSKARRTAVNQIDASCESEGNLYDLERVSKSTKDASDVAGYFTKDNHPYQNKVNEAHASVGDRHLEAFLHRTEKPGDVHSITASLSTQKVDEGAEEESVHDALDARGCRGPRKYAPPRLRSAEGELENISRRFRGLLNRLAESNAHTIAEDIQRLIQNAASIPRRVAARAYAEAALNAVRDGTRSLQTNPYAPIHAAVACYLGNVVDISICAEVVAVLVTRLVKLLENKTEGSEICGYVSYFSCLCELGVLASGMVFEFVQVLSSDFSERNVELLLILLRRIGPMLRSENPVALRDILVLVKNRASDAQWDATRDGNVSKRVDIMLDLLYEIKDKKIRWESDGKSKFPWAGCPMSTLCATFEQLQDGEFVKSRWWDCSRKIHVKSLTGETVKCQKSCGARKSSAINSVDLLQLAAAQRINTDFRRSVFTAVMGSLDVDDSFSRLELLDAFDKRNGRDRDSVRVILHCCGAERRYNQFYGELCSRICRSCRSLRFALEYALWEVLNNILSTLTNQKAAPRKVKNYGKLLGYLLKTSSVRLLALRNGPDMDSCSRLCAEFYCNAFSDLFSHRVEKVTLEAVMRDACQGKSLIASSFRTSLAGFLNRELRQWGRGVAGDRVSFAVSQLEQHVAR